MWTASAGLYRATLMGLHINQKINAKKMLPINRNPIDFRRIFQLLRSSFFIRGIVYFINMQKNQLPIWGKLSASSFRFY